MGLMSQFGLREKRVLLVLLSSCHGEIDKDINIKSIFSPSTYKKSKCEDLQFHQTIKADIYATLASRCKQINYTSLRLFVYRQIKSRQKLLLTRVRRVCLCRWAVTLELRRSGLKRTGKIFLKLRLSGITL